VDEHVGEVPPHLIPLCGIIDKSLGHGPRRERRRILLLDLVHQKENQFYDGDDDHADPRRPTSVLVFVQLFLSVRHIVASQLLPRYDEVHVLGHVSAEDILEPGVVDHGDELLVVEAAVVIGVGDLVYPPDHLGRRRRTLCRANAPPDHPLKFRGGNEAVAVCICLVSTYSQSPQSQKR
jgi:hypothetical protein